MRLSKSLRIVFGIAASGGVAFLLSGSAFAADGGQSTTSENVTGNILQNVQDKGGAVVGAASDSKTVVNDNKKTVEIGGSVDGTSATKKDPVNTADKPVVGLSDSTVKQPDNGAATTSTTNVQPGAGVKTDTASADSDSSSKPKVVAADVKPVDPDNGGQVAKDATQVAELVPDVVFHSAVLPVRAKITNSRPVVVEDLATMVPSAPAQQQNPAKVPTPSQPSGVFGRITAAMAGSVVPRAFLVPLSGVVRFAAQIVIVVTIPLLAFSSLVYGFGAVLRRGGYVHAARSDVSAGISVFATPFRLGYVPALQPSHNPFLVADTKTVLSMSATLQERRK